MNANQRYRANCRAEGRRINKGNHSAQIQRWKANQFRWRKPGADIYLQAEKQCPPWADIQAILKIYRLAKALREATGQRWVVDHIVPVRGENVSGLHVHTNLQVILQADNNQKANR